MHGVDFVSLVSDMGTDASRWGLVTSYLRDQSQLAPSPVPLKSPWAKLSTEEQKPRRDLYQSLIRASVPVVDWGRLRTLMSDELAARVVSDVREATTYAEAVNSRKLEQLAWCWAEADRMAGKCPEQARDYERIRETFEGIAAHAWGLDRLSTERGWAQAQTRRYDLLPTVLREWGR